MMSQSDQLNELFAALAKAQAEMHGAKRDTTNPHFKAKFASLEATWEACREALSNNGLCVIQVTHATADGPILETTLGHQSGQWIRGVTPLILDREGMQPLGSAITYARRYGLQSMTGIAPVDDDGEAATDHEKKPDVIGAHTKSKLKEEMRAFDTALHRTTSVEELEKVLEDYAEILEQCKRDMPGWWKSDPKRDFVGPMDRVKRQRQSLMDAEPSAAETWVASAIDMLTESKDLAAVERFEQQNAAHIEALLDDQKIRLVTVLEATKKRLSPRQPDADKPGAKGVRQTEKPELEESSSAESPPDDDQPVLMP